jgi:hypothetical protein
MPHIHWVARQNNLEISRDKDEVNKREIHECDGRAHDPGTMVVPQTPKPTRKAEALVRAPPTIALCREEDAALRKWPLPQYCCASCILETKTKVGSTSAKAPAPRTHPNIDETPTTPKSHTHPSHNCCAINGLKIVFIVFFICSRIKGESQDFLVFMLFTINR